MMNRSRVSSVEKLRVANVGRRTGYAAADHRSGETYRRVTKHDTPVGQDWRIEPRRTEEAGDRNTGLVHDSQRGGNAGRETTFNRSQIKAQYCLLTSSMRSYTILASVTKKRPGAETPERFCSSRKAKTS